MQDVHEWWEHDLAGVSHPQHGINVHQNEANKDINQLSLLFIWSTSTFLIIVLILIADLDDNLDGAFKAC